MDYTGGTRIRFTVPMRREEDKSEDISTQDSNLSGKRI